MSAQACSRNDVNRRYGFRRFRFFSLKRGFNVLFRLLRYNSAAMEYKRLSKE